MSKRSATGRHASSNSAPPPSQDLRGSARGSTSCRSPAFDQRLRQLQAPRRVIPEEIVGDEDVIAGGGEVVAHRGDAGLPRTARWCSCQMEQNRATRNGQPRAVSISDVGRWARHGSRMRPALATLMPCRQRHLVELKMFRSHRRSCTIESTPHRPTPPGTSLSARPLRHRAPATITASHRPFTGMPKSTTLTASIAGKKGNPHPGQAAHRAGRRQPASQRPGAARRTRAASATRVIRRSRSACIPGDARTVPDGR